MTIKDIYAGKPDAGDEILEKGYDSFANYFIAPSGVDIDGLASNRFGTPIFIIGDKGTGKTALLHYLEHHVHEIDEYACTSFIAIRREFDAVVLNKFDVIGKAISSALCIDNKVASIGEDSECDYTYIWRWQLYQRIIDDNEQFNGGLFLSDEKWDSFVNTIRKISATIDRNTMRIPAEIKIFATADPVTGTLTPGMSISPLDVKNRNFSNAKSYEAFVGIIQKADLLFSELTRSETSYYIFIDELEAYRNDDGLFFRDLRLIRDLLFTVKKLNGVLKTGTKILCSVRQEIITSINRFINPYQLQKITQGYDVRLMWKHTNTNSFSHPIMEILLKRINEAEIQGGSGVTNRNEIINHWFAKAINKQHICSYILEKTWHKPRDVVRLLLAAQSTRAKDFTCFNQHTFETFMPVYSKQCLDELREEMRALYTNNEIESIFRCIQGYKTSFSLQDIKERAHRIEAGSVLAVKTSRVLEDLYRIGIIGNHLEGGRSDQWAHKEYYRLILEDPWQMIIHPALHAELSIGRRTDRIIEIQKTEPVDREIHSVTIRVIRPRYVRVSFMLDGNPAQGYISINNLGIENVNAGMIEQFLSIGDSLKAKRVRYDSEYNNWVMKAL